MSNAAANIRITYTPARVAVSDDRGEVQGWEVSIAYPSGTVSGAIIPPEGPDPSAWLGSLHHEPDAVRVALAEQAEEVALLDLFEADELGDGWVVRDLVDGSSVWTPSEEAAAEIDAADDNEETAARICCEEPHRGEWSS